MVEKVARHSEAHCCSNQRLVLHGIRSKRGKHKRCCCRAQNVLCACCRFFGYSPQASHILVLDGLLEWCHCGDHGDLMTQGVGKLPTAVVPS